MTQNGTWKDGELAYVADLLVTQGNQSVPRDSVSAYLKTQLASGPGEIIPTHVSAALYTALGYIAVGNWERAARVVKAAADMERGAK